MARFIIHWVTLSLALAATAWLLPGIVVDGWVPLLVGALVLGLMNAVVRPVVGLVTLPLTILTPGLFYFVVNGITFGLAAWVVPGFSVSNFWHAMLGALVCSVLSWLIGAFTGDNAPRKRQRAREA